ncbi:hypothetical protein ACFQJ7_08005 [Halovenus rubra]|uniref:Uncharacterized protein n=2 Tax=Halovenus rubra TaxID=869890 RepID=A0ACC7E4N9_9EURY|nr:hypothetical protein [Halovenus rubra]
MADTSETHHESPSDRVRDHLLQLDHWTFLLALGLVSANVILTSRVVSASAASLLVIALCYDLYEFYRQ